MNKLIKTMLTVAAFLLMALPGLAEARDSDHDGMPNRWENKQCDKLSSHRKDARRDADHDGLRNRAEFRAHTKACDADTDDDGVEDDDDVAGVIASFENGVLTIDLAGGGQVSGLVDDTTEIECEDEDEHATASHDGEDNSGPGSDSSGPGSDGDRDDDEDDENDEDDNCAASDLATGVVVHEAELELRDGKAVFEEVEILK